MKLTIWHGKQTPIIARGKHQVNLLSFAEKYRGWHTYSKDKATINAVTALQSKGCLELIDDQFRFVYPD